MGPASPHDPRSDTLQRGSCLRSVGKPQFHSLKSAAVYFFWTDRVKYKNHLITTDAVDFNLETYGVRATILKTCLTNTLPHRSLPKV